MIYFYLENLLFHFVNPRHSLYILVPGEYLVVFFFFILAVQGIFILIKMFTPIPKVTKYFTKVFHNIMRKKNLNSKKISVRWNVVGKIFKNFQIFSQHHLRMHSSLVEYCKFGFIGWILQVQIVAARSSNPTFGYVSGWTLSNLLVNRIYNRVQIVVKKKCASSSLIVLPNMNVCLATPSKKIFPKIVILKY